MQVPREGPGCSKPLLIGCGLVFLLLLLGVGVLVTQSTSIVRWWFHTFEMSLGPRLPADLTPAERLGLHRAFEAAARDIGRASGDGGVQQLEAFQRELMKLSNPQTPITRRDVLELTDVLNGLAGRPSPPASPAPASPAPGTPGAVPPPTPPPAPAAPPGGGGAEIPATPRA